MLARGFQVVRRPDRSRRHDLDLAEVAARFFGPFADKAETPFDEIRVGELENHAVADTSGGAQRFRAIAADPDTGDFAIGPGKFCGDAVKVHSLARVKVAKHAYEFLKCLKRCRLFPEDAA